MPQYVTMYEEYLKRDVAHHVSIQCNLTNTCPQHCIMCSKPEWAQIQTVAGKNNIDYQVLATELNNMPHLETVVLSGGDPMNYRNLKPFLEDLKPKYSLGMFTTGLDNGINRYKDLPLERFGYIRFSIDGYSPEVWSKIRGTPARAYETAWKNVIETAEAFKTIHGEDFKQKIRVQFTIQSENISQFPDMVLKCWETNIPIYGYWVHDFNVVTFSQVENLRFDLNYLIERKPRFSEWAKHWTNVHSLIEMGDQVSMALDAKNCVIPLVHAFIDTDGSVFPCCYLVGDNLPFDQREEKYSYGNIYQRPLTEILSTQNIEKVRQKYINNQNDICRACSSNQSRYYRMNLEAYELKHRRPTFL